MRRFNNKSRRSIKSTKSINKKKISFILIVFIFLILGFLAFLVFKVITLDKFVYVNKIQNGDAQVVVVDSKKDLILKYLISGETELEASNGYGVYKLKNLWILSDKDVASTIVKNYSIPVYLWKDGNKSNLNLYQKVKVFFVSKQKIDYEATLDSFKLSDSILINFLNENISDRQLKIEVEDLTGTQSIINKVARVIDTTGGKIHNNSKGYDESLDCEIIGKDKEVVGVLSNVFGCSSIVSNNIETDIKIRLGVKFAQRF